MNVELKKRVRHKLDSKGEYYESVVEIEGIVEVEGIRLRRTERVYTDLTCDSSDRIERIKNTINEIVVSLLGRANTFKKNLAELRRELGDFEEIID